MQGETRDRRLSRHWPRAHPPRLREANRTQVCLRPVDLEGLLPEDHRARIVWAYVEGLDLTPPYQPIQAVDGEAGRPATDPKLLLALWLYATLSLDAGLPTSWATLREELTTHQVVTVVLPASNGDVLKIRRGSTPDPRHTAIYATLHIPSEVMKPVKTWVRAIVTE